MNFTQSRFLRAARIKWSRIKGFLNSGDSILDVGAGSCALSHIIRENGYKVEALDLKNKSRFPNFKSMEYDGTDFPVNENQYDTTLLITMLHHTPDPIHIIKECMRVSKRIIIIEDIYNNWFQKQLTFFVDSLVNMEFRGHPHTNKTHEEWLRIFNDLRAKVAHVEQRRFLLFFRQVTYVLEID